MGRAYRCRWIIDICVTIGTDDFSIINQGFTGEVDIVGVFGVFLRASIADVHG